MPSMSAVTKDCVDVPYDPAVLLEVTQAVFILAICKWVISKFSIHGRFRLHLSVIGSALSREAGTILDTN